MNKTTAIISAFPACGKSYYHNKSASKGFTTLDSDSSLFSWTLDSDGKSTGVRNPDFPQNYMEHIKRNVGKVDFIFVSSHEEVREALELEDLSYVSVMPDISLKFEWLGRCWLRGSPEGFLKLINSQWDNWVSPVNNMKWSPCGKVTLSSGQYLSDHIHFLETMKYNK